MPEIIKIEHCYNVDNYCINQLITQVKPESEGNNYELK